MTGDYPKERASAPVAKLHRWATRRVHDYPDGSPDGRTLLALSGPYRETSPSVPSSIPDAGCDPDMDAGTAPVVSMMDLGRTDGSLTPAEALAHPGTSWNSADARSGQGPLRWVALAVVTLAVVLLATVVAVTRRSGPGHDNPSDADSRAKPISSPAGVVPTRAAVPEGSTIREVSDNHAGTAVYANPTGASAGDLAPSRIPFGKAVDVRCVAPNRTGSSSIYALYLIASGPWRGLYAVSDTFTNGEELGTPGGHVIDSRIPDCPS